MAQPQKPSESSPPVSSSASRAVKPGARIVRAYFTEAVDFGGAKVGKTHIDMTVEPVTKTPRDGSWIQNIELHPAGLLVEFERKKQGDGVTGPVVTKHRQLVYAGVIKNVELEDAEA